MNCSFNNYLSYGVMMLIDMKLQNQQWKERIHKQWKESQNFPRKKKKSVRKNLLLEWQIACYDPMGLNEINVDEMLNICNIF